MTVGPAGRGAAGGGPAESVGCGVVAGVAGAGGGLASRRGYSGRYADGRGDARAYGKR